MSILDRLFRRQSRPTAVRMLEAASGRRWEKTPPFGPLPAEIMAGAANARNRARHLRHNDPLAANAVEILKTGLVGYGVTAAPKTSDKAPRAELTDAWNAWVERTGFAALQAELVDVLATDGESFVVMRADENGLDLQHVPAEMIDESMTMQLSDGRYAASGVEYGPDDRPIAYHIRRHRLTDIFATAEPPTRVPAEDVIHVFKRDGAGQHRGLTHLAPVVLPLHELSQLHDALLVSAKVQAMHTGWLKDTVGTGTAFADGQQVGDLLNVSLEPGVVRVLPSGWDISFSNPAQMQQSVDFAAHSIRLIAAGLQIPEFLLSGDMRNVNYSSARTALVQFRQHLERIQHTILVPAFNRIWERWLLTAGFDHVPVDWHFAKMPWVDPLREVNATIRSIEAGLISRRMAVAELGYDLETVDAERAADPMKGQSDG